MILTYNDIIIYSEHLSKQLPENKYKYVYGVNAGGILSAHIISGLIGAELISESALKPGDDVLVITDFVDSIGSELKLFTDNGFDTAALYRQTSKKLKDKNIFHPTYCVNLLDSEDVVYLPY